MIQIISAFQFYREKEQSSLMDEGSARLSQSFPLISLDLNERSKWTEAKESKRKTDETPFPH